MHSAFGSLREIPHAARRGDNELRNGLGHSVVPQGSEDVICDVALELVGNGDRNDRVGRVIRHVTGSVQINEPEQKPHPQSSANNRLK
jgi:hypothetical protein